MRLIKLRVHPTPSPSPPSCYMFKDEDREPRLGRFLRKALTLLSKGSSGASRDVMTIVSSTLDQATASGKQGGKKVSKTSSSQVYEAEDRDWRERESCAHKLALIACCLPGFETFNTRKTLFLIKIVLQSAENIREVL